MSNLRVYAQKVYYFTHTANNPRSPVQGSLRGIGDQKGRLLDEGNRLIGRDFSKDPISSAYIEKVQKVLEVSSPSRNFAKLSREQQTLVNNAVTLTEKEHKLKEKMDSTLQNSFVTGHEEAEGNALSPLKISLALSDWCAEYTVFSAELKSFQEALPKEHPLRDIFCSTF